MKKNSMVIYQKKKKIGWQTNVELIMNIIKDRINNASQKNVVQY